MGVRIVLSDVVPKKKLKLIRIRGRNFCVTCESVFKREKNEASKFILKLEEEIKKKHKHIRNKVLGDTLRFATKICEEIQLAPYNMKNHGDKIDASDLELLQKLDKLDKKLDTLIRDSTDKYEYPINTEQKIYNAWKKIYKTHPICGRAVGFMLATIITAIVAVFINNLFAKEEKCECNYCGQIQYVNEMTINYGY